MRPGRAGEHYRSLQQAAWFPAIILIALASTPLGVHLLEMSNTLRLNPYGSRAEPCRRSSRW